MLWCLPRLKQKANPPPAALPCPLPCHKHKDPRFQLGHCHLDPSTGGAVIDWLCGSLRTSPDQHRAVIPGLWVHGPARKLASWHHKNAAARAKQKKNGLECLGGSIPGVSFAVWTLYGTIMTPWIDLATQIGRTVSSAATLYSTVANYGAQAPKSSAQVISGSILGVSSAA